VSQRSGLTTGLLTLIKRETDGEAIRNKNIEEYFFSTINSSRPQPDFTT
ncbi:2863_t:CDS:2, partial [Funneliformis mosseae]